jgi:alcohol dehydrogenase class IV
MDNTNLRELRKFVAPEFVFGNGSLRLAGQYADNLGMNRVLLVSDPGVERHGWTARVRDALLAEGFSCVPFTSVSQNPRDHEVMAGAEAYLAEACDGIVVVGGGSAMDLAKGVGIASANGRHILEFEGVDNVPRPSPPLVCIPTTAGSSADVSQFAIITDTDRRVKIAIVSKTVVADAALVDPSTTVTMDEELTRNTGLDALTHAIEAYVSNASGPMTDMFALKAVELIGRALPAALERPDDLRARTDQMLGSMYAGLAFSNAILGAVHAMAHSLGGLLDLPHGQCNAILLDHVLDYNFEAVPERCAEIARALGADVPAGAPEEERRQRSVEAVRAFKRRVGMHATLAGLGVSRDDLRSLAESAMLDPCMATNPRQPQTSDILRVFENAL